MNSFVIVSCSDCRVEVIRLVQEICFTRTQAELEQKCLIYEAGNEAISTRFNCVNVSLILQSPMPILKLTKANTKIIQVD